MKHAYRFTSRRQPTHTSVRALDANELADAVLRLNGGGHTTRQTARSMEQLAEIREGNKVLVGPLYVEKVKGDEHV